MPSLNTKRQRLLAKYIEKKLLKEEKQRLLEKLGAEAQQRRLLKAGQPQPPPSSGRSGGVLSSRNAHTRASSPESGSEPGSSGEEDLEGFLQPPGPTSPAAPADTDTLPASGRLEGLSSDEEELVDFMPRDLSSSAAPAVFRIFERHPDIVSSRQSLPILGEEQRIVEMIKYNDISFVTGETGSGKTTQVPQFLLEAGFPGTIAVTQPRRVAAMSMAERVGTELGPSGPSLVSYHVRYEKTRATGPQSLVVFMTDGILLRMISADFLLPSLSVVIIDEAHERNLNTDLLLGLLTRIVRLRRKKSPQAPLKLVVMSATLRVSDFVGSKSLFPSSSPVPPVVNVPSRQFPVAVHFSKITPSDPLDAAYKKVLQIDRKLPPGGVLVFVAGQDQVWQLVRRLGREDHEHGTDETEAGDDLFSADVAERAEEDARAAGPPAPPAVSPSGLRVLPFYAMLPLAEQMKIFEEGAGEGRLVVVSTNLAETSLTIPGISYVVDTGLVKQRSYSSQSISRYNTGWTSKASAQQRSGRAGRTGPGHAYRLYSAALFEDLFPDVHEPEILRIPTENMVLQMKAMHIDNVRGFPFPTAPPEDALERSERLLFLLGALAARDEKDGVSRISPAGRLMAHFPLHPRMSRMLVDAFERNVPGLVPLALDLVSGMCGIEPHCPSPSSAGPPAPPSDPFSTMLAFQRFHSALRDEGMAGAEAVCSAQHLPLKTLVEASRLRSQLEAILKRSFENVAQDDLEYLLEEEGRESDEKRPLLHRELMEVLVGSYGDQLARVSPEQPEPRRRREWLGVGLGSGSSWMAPLPGPAVLDTRSSVFSGATRRFGPSSYSSDWIIYGEAAKKGDRLVLSSLSRLSEDVLRKFPMLCPRVCSYSNDQLDGVSDASYSPRDDAVVALARPMVGSLELPFSCAVPVERLLAAGSAKNSYRLSCLIYNVFGRALLEGTVVAEPFSAYASLLLGPKPEALLKVHQQNLAKCVAWRQALQKMHCVSRQRLEEIWASSPMYLLREWLLWMPPEHQESARSSWKKARASASRV